MPQGRRDGRAFDPFFRGLRASVLDAWVSAEGYAYDRVMYSVRYPYGEGDVARALAFAGRKEEFASLPSLRPLNRQLLDSRYPELAREAPAGLSAEGWSAVLHFLDPSYPLASPAVAVALKRLGFELPSRLEPSDYPAFVKALDVLKEKSPVWAVPETNWYLARVLEVGLAAFASGAKVQRRSGRRVGKQGLKDVRRRARVLEKRATVHDRRGH